MSSPADMVTFKPDYTVELLYTSGPLSAFHLRKIAVYFTVVQCVCFSALELRLEDCACVGMKLFEARQS